MVMVLTGEDIQFTPATPHSANNNGTWAVNKQHSSCSYYSTPPTPPLTHMWTLYLWSWQSHLAYLPNINIHIPIYLFNIEFKLDCGIVSLVCSMDQQADPISWGPQVNDNNSTHVVVHSSSGHSRVFWQGSGVEGVVYWMGTWRHVCDCRVESVTNKIAT